MVSADAMRGRSFSEINDLCNAKSTELVGIW